MGGWRVALQQLPGYAVLARGWHCRGWHSLGGSRRRGCRLVLDGDARLLGSQHNSLRLLGCQLQQHLLLRREAVVWTACVAPHAVLSGALMHMADGKGTVCGQQACSNAEGHAAQQAVDV